MTNEQAGIEVGDADNIIFFEVLLKAFPRGLAAKVIRELVHYQSADLGARRLLFVGYRSIVSDVGVGVDDDLTVIRRVGVNFLIPPTCRC